MEFQSIDRLGTTVRRSGLRLPGLALLAALTSSCHEELVAAEDCGVDKADCSAAASQAYEAGYQACFESGDTGDTATDTGGFEACLAEVSSTRDAALAVCDQKFEACMNQ